MEKRFRALRFVGTLYKILGVIAAVLTAFVALGFCLFAVTGSSVLSRYSQDIGIGSLGSGALFGGLAALGALLYGGLVAVSLYAIGEGIYLFLALEENTRATRLQLERQSAARPAISQESSITG